MSWRQDVVGKATTRQKGPSGPPIEFGDQTSWREDAGMRTYPREAGPPGPRLSSPEERERHTAMPGGSGEVTVLQSLFSLQLPLTRNLTNKMRGTYFSKEVFARLYYCVVMILHAHVDVYVLCVCIVNHGHGYTTERAIPYKGTWGTHALARNPTTPIAEPSNPACIGCGSHQYGILEMGSRQLKYSAWGQTCNYCGKAYHFSDVCRAKKKKKKTWWATTKSSETNEASMDTLIAHITFSQTTGT